MRKNLPTRSFCVESPRRSRNTAWWSRVGNEKRKSEKIAQSRAYAIKNKHYLARYNDLMIMVIIRSLAFSVLFVWPKYTVQRINIFCFGVTCASLYHEYSYYTEALMIISQDQFAQIKLLTSLSGRTG